ncbi:SIMPL domain-containing protein [Streptomyces sp. NPDC051315]|uniref:SIMPL domain-containing protein n=1 Tax=Streptomyces sp. NPDC051315 TaxID=3365650 RepID=UPI0037AFAEE4
MALPRTPLTRRPLPRTPLRGTPVTAAVVTLLALGLPAVAAPAAAALPTHPAQLAHQAPARVAPSPATLTVTGEGSASAAPDLAVVVAGVEAVADSPQKAVDAQTRAANALLRAVRGRGVAERDIRTENLSLSPVYDHADGASRLKGYQAAQSFSVTVREVRETGAVVQAITDVTGEAARITSVAFAVSDPAPLQARARRAAHQDARAKALEYAGLSGRRLGRLVSLSEDAAGYPRPVPAAADAIGANSGVPVTPGVIRATATVTAVYELD